MSALVMKHVDDCMPCSYENREFRLASFIHDYKDGKRLVRVVCGEGGQRLSPAVLKPFVPRPASNIAAESPRAYIPVQAGDWVVTVWNRPTMSVNIQQAVGIVRDTDHDEEHMLLLRNHSLARNHQSGSSFTDNTMDRIFSGVFSEAARNALAALDNASLDDAPFYQ